MARPFDRAQGLENAAFIAALTRTGNVRAAARAIGRAAATMHGRRAAHPAFAQQWDVAVAMADARLLEDGGGRLADSAAKAGGAVGHRSASDRTASHRTLGGEAVVVQRRDGKLQVRSAQPGKITRQCEQAFLAALSATANIRLSAAAAGASPAAFYRRRRRNPGFAREMHLALEMGYTRIEEGLLESFEVGAHEHDAWRHNEPPPLPAMTVNQALQLLYLHHKTARLWAQAPHMTRRRGESSQQWSERRAAEYRAAKTRETEALKMAATNAALHAALDRIAPLPHEPPPPVLPALDQVTGWSQADADKTPHDPTRALFGGWRFEDLERRRRE
ncbi:hypothetical protein OKW76_15270 [Sphingomonas sp. S1-29]|uniref:hypothetical protein n=1 Tax=Sphingomonas sp. S1-29 TaxID=2991074 RepID=UPI00223EA605|nr:hypothetical protein [Sphingomonas sp. S1-29]UZK69352.1 hypothetical protein OKW76_15270 [Sphingomonas sp. S1-29]